MKEGYALASIDYRHSTTAIFPAQIQDCNRAAEFLHQNAAKYHFNKNNFIVMGFSAGGHLASLMGLSLNNNVEDFYPAKMKPSFTIKAVLDYYGAIDLLMFFGMNTPEQIDNPIAKLLGVSPLARPDISKHASPDNYIDKNDPPFFVVHGELDKDVPPAQSYLLRSLLTLAGVKNELTIVKSAPHYGEMFDQEEIRTKLFSFLESLK